MWQESTSREIAHLFLDAQSVSIERARNGFTYHLDLLSAGIDRLKDWESRNVMHMKSVRKAWRQANKGRPRNRKPLDAKQRVRKTALQRARRCAK